MYNNLSFGLYSAFRVIRDFQIFLYALHVSYNVSPNIIYFFQFKFFPLKTLGSNMSVFQAIFSLTDTFIPITQ